MPGRIAWPVEIALIALILFAPLAYGGRLPWAVFVLQAGAFLLLAVCLLFGNSVSRSRVRSETLLPAWVIVPFLVWIGVQLLQLVPLPVGLLSVVSPERARLAEVAGVTGWTTWSVAPHETIKAALMSSAYVSLFVVAYLSVRRRLPAKVFAWAVVAAGVFQALYGTVEYLTGSPAIFGVQRVFYTDFATGTFINRNHFASYLALCFGVLSGIVFYAMGKNGQSIASRAEKLSLPLFLEIVLVAALVFSGSRGAAGALVVAVAAAHLMRPSRWHAARSAIVAVVLLAGVAALASWTGRAPVLERLRGVPAEMVTANHRLDAWKTTGRMIAAHPVLGGGSGTYESRYPLYRATGKTVNFDHAHSDVLEWTADTGAVGALALYGGIVAALVLAARRIRERNSTLSARYALGGIIGVVAVLVHQTVDFPMQMPGIAFTLFAVLGWTCAVATRRLT